MSQLHRVRSIEEFHEKDKDQGVERMYLYYKTESSHLHTEKQEVDLLVSPVWGKMLFLDGVLQSTTQDEAIYHNALVHPLLDTLTSTDAILILGGGEGATAREVLRWPDLKRLTMVDYDKEFVEHMMKHGDDWSCGAFEDPKLKLVYADAWEYMKTAGTYDGIIIDLTDPSPKKDKWDELLENVMRSVKPRKGGFVLNAGLYLPWKTDTIKLLKSLVEALCLRNPEYKYYIYTAMIPSFNGEWTFITVSHKAAFMTDPEFLELIPKWIRRGLRTLDTVLIDI
jgi:spermidine synthase